MAVIMMDSNVRVMIKNTPSGRRCSNRGDRRDLCGNNDLDFISRSRFRVAV